MRRGTVGLVALVAISLLASPRGPLAQGRSPVPVPLDVLTEARARDSVRVIVSLDVPFRPEHSMTAAQEARQRAAIAAAGQGLLARLAGGRFPRFFSTLPYLAIEVDAADLPVLAAAPEVASIELDALARPTLAQSTPLVGAVAAWAAGYTGAGWTVAVLDTGVEKTHPFLAGRIVSEACFSTTSSFSSSVCPGGAASSTAPDSALPCSMSNCGHGTHVAGIAAGSGASFSGVARDASLIAIQVFSASTSCGSDPVPCPRSFQSDQIAALERVYTLRNTLNIAAVNMSLGGGLFTSPCDTNATKAAIDQLRSAGIATVISSGNDGQSGSISSPACISTAVSVGSTTDGSFGQAVDQVSSFSNSSPYLTMLAPGQVITSSVPGGGFANFTGTSMAAPHVAGAWAVLRSRRPDATLDEILAAVVSTGPGILDLRNGLVKPRLQVDAALQALVPPCTYSVTPTAIPVDRAGGAFTVSVSAPPGCPWTAVSQSAFVFITAGDTGSGPGVVTAIVGSNPSSSPRAGQIVVAGTPVSITQGGAFASGDIGGDGRADLVWYQGGTGRIAAWYLNGHEVIATLPFSIDRVTDLSWRIAGTGDVDGDGHADLVWQNVVTGRLAVWLLDGRQVRATLPLSIDRVTDLAWKICGVGDIDGDGMADLIWRHETTGELAAWHLRGTQVVGTNYMSVSRVADTNWVIAGAGDTNGDGMADLVWQHETTGDLAVWFLDNLRVASTVRLSIERMADVNWKIRGVGDADGDGRADLLWQNRSDGGLGVWFLNGAVVREQLALSIDRVTDLNWWVVGPG